MVMVSFVANPTDPAAEIPKAVRGGSRYHPAAAVLGTTS
jgi:hypothetical protein